jgi:hypothetical protein
MRASIVASVLALAVAVFAAPQTPAPEIKYELGSDGKVIFPVDYQTDENGIVIPPEVVRCPPELCPAGRARTASEIMSSFVKACGC